MNPRLTVSGLEWDLLYIGSCWDIPRKEKPHKHETYEDPSAPNSNEYVQHPSSPFWYLEHRETSPTVVSPNVVPSRIPY